jgi:hypothetical protein
MSRPTLLGAICLTAALSFSIAAAQSSSVRFISFDEAKPTLELLAHLRPPELAGLDNTELQMRWPGWISQHDAVIRSRVEGGDIDSVVNLVLYGTSFTSERRLTARQLEEMLAAPARPAAGAEIDRVTRARIDDFVRGAAHPDGNERLAAAARTLQSRGFELATSGGRSLAADYLLKELGRVLREAQAYERLSEEARSPGDPSAEFAWRSKMYEGRGLSSDTSLAPNFALDEALTAMRARGLLPTTIHRVAVLGPGLDFVDKQEGYDFYPVQTLQPFAVLDSLQRLQPGSGHEIRISTFDVNPRVNRHLERLRDGAKAGEVYLLHLPLDASEPWTKAFLEYWRAFGGRIGTDTKVLRVPDNAGPIAQRAVSVRPEHAARIVPLDLDIVTQRFALPPSERFDLIVGTNVFLYYNEFQQSLAMANIEAMLTPGGILLSNHALVELPSSPLRSAGASKVSYSARPNSGDVIVWYQKVAN